TTGPPHALLPSSATHLTFFSFPFSTLQSSGRFFSARLTMFRCGVPPNSGQDPSSGGAASGGRFIGAAGAGGATCGGPLFEQPLPRISAPRTSSIPAGRPTRIQGQQFIRKLLPLSPLAPLGRGVGGEGK